MNIKNFEEYFGDTILERGLLYYQEGRVASIEFDGAEWTAEVDGSCDYTVTVKLDNSGEILDTECDCPYDWGEYCKHQAAVFCELRNKNKWKEQIKTSAQSIDSLLSSQSKAVLVDVLKEYANRDKRIKDDLLFRFSPHKDKVSYAQKLIQSSIKAVSKRGFVEWDDVFDAVEGAAQALKMAQEEIDNPLTCVSICFAVLRGMMELLPNCDDSENYVSEIILDAIDLIKELAEQSHEPCADTQKLFELIYSHSLERIYDGWEYRRIELLNACVPMCRFPDIRHELEKRLSLLETGENRHLASGIQDLRCKIIEEYDGPDAAESYKERHLDNRDFRKAIINKSIETGQFDRALTLCLDGEQADAKHAGLLSDWENVRYTIYEKQNNISAQKELALRFAMDGEFSYYLTLKSLYEENEWPAVLQDILNKMDAAQYKPRIYEKIIIHENLKTRLFEQCKKDGRSVVRLYSYLLPEYKPDLDELFLQYIRKMAKGAFGRSHYRQIGIVIKQYAETFGMERGIAIRNELLAKYPRRPAFRDELEKIGFG